MKAPLFFVGLILSIYAVAEAKTGRGRLFDNWLLLPPRSYLALIGGVLCLLIASFLLGRGQSGGP